MKIFNSLTGKLEDFVSISEGKVLMYVCGPTVYNLIHIGNARPIVVFDCFRRFLEYRGYDVCYVQNFTDLDDKIIAGAKKENLTASELSRKYIREYEKDADGLLVSSPSFAPRVSECVDMIIELIERLIANGAAYEVCGDVFFNTASFENYGKLSKMDLENLSAGKRVEVSSKKRSSLDFVLWKKAKEGEPFFKSPWGLGRPGWHIECSAMAINYLAETIDIHCGGQDLIFPHHENEIAQSEKATGKKFVNYWMHNGYINIDSRKMSKSLGNFLTVREIAKLHGYEPIRFMLLKEHYRTPINYSEQIISQCEASLSRIKNFESSVLFLINSALSGKISKELENSVEDYRARFISALEDDFNTASAVAVVFDFIREMNTLMNCGEQISKESLILIKDLFYEFNGVLKFFKPEVEQSCEIPKEVLELFERRRIARKDRDFSLADELRDEIKNMGYLVEETRNGDRIFPIK